MSRSEILQEAVAWKTDLLKAGELVGICENEQMMNKDTHLDSFFQELTDEQSPNITTNFSSEGNEEIGLALYMIVLHCPKETLKLGQFLLTEACKGRDSAVIDPCNYQYSAVQ